MGDSIEYCEQCFHANDKAVGPLDAAACSPPLGENGEAYYCKRDDFTRYLEEVVNPARIAANLAPLDKRTAEECYRILNDFARKWGCKPIAENNQTHPTGDNR
jgi:hypothetical protein